MVVMVVIQSGKYAYFLVISQLALKSGSINATNSHIISVY